MTVDTFVIDVKDNPAELTAEVAAQNSVLMEHVEHEMERFGSIPCDCGLNGDTMLVMRGSEAVEVPADQVSDNDIILTPIDAQNGVQNEAAEDDDDNAPFEYRAIIQADDSKYTDVVALIRRCKRCGDIRIRGNIDEITKTIGYAYMTTVDYEQNSGIDTVESGCSVNDCANCQSKCESQDVNPIVNAPQEEKEGEA